MATIDELTSAIQQGDIAAIDRALAAGADLNGVDESGRTPLIQAVLLPKPNKELAAQLLERGADPNRCDTVQGFSALAHAIQVNRLQTAKVLLDHGADPNTRDLFGNTPLFRLVFAQGAEKAIRLLLAAGADKDAANLNGATPRQVAVNMGNPALAELLS